MLDTSPLNPQRWEEVPAKVYEPRARAQALDEDGVDAEVLFPNTPIQNFGFMQARDAEFELACVQAYNSALAEWRATSDRFVPLALIPYLGGIEAAVAEVERAAQIGHRGVTLLCEPSTLNVLRDRRTPTTGPEPGGWMIGTAVSVSGRKVPGSRMD